MISRISVALAFACLLKGQEVAQLKSIRAWSQPEVTRVIVELTGAPSFRHDKLPSPARVYFDLTQASMNLDSAPGKKFAVTPVSDQLVQRVRAAENTPGVTRLVFDLAAENALYTVSELQNPPRLVVEFRAATTTPAARRSDPAPPPAVPQITVDQMRQEAKRAATGKVAPPPIAIAAKAPASSPVTLQAATLPVYAPPIGTPPPEIPIITPPVGEPARRAGRSMTRALGLKLGKIVIDPGHGGHDYGTTSPGGLHEKDLVLDVAKRLGALLEEKLGATVVYTREDDTFVSLERRTEFANQQRADLFLSIHANSSPARSVAGPETFYLNFTTTRDAMEVAARENASSGKTIFELQDLVKKIALNEKLSESREFASRVQSSLSETSLRAGLRFRDRGVKRAPFVVLIGAAMPSVLTELGFVTNEREESLFRKPEHRQRLAEGLYKGIAQYANTLSRFQVAAAGGSTGESR